MGKPGFQFQPSPPPLRVVSGNNFSKLQYSIWKQTKNTNLLGYGKDKMNYI